MPHRGGRELRVVAIGGGTGLSTLLKGLKKYVGRQSGETAVSPITGSESARIAELCAVVTVTDDGGSSGRLRREFDVLPPGDIRNCLVALSEDEALLSRLFQYRFGGGQGLKGHSFGNLFLTALTHLTGDFSQAVRTSSVPQLPPHPSSSESPNAPRHRSDRVRRLECAAREPDRMRSDGTRSECKSRGHDAN